MQNKCHVIGSHFNPKSLAARTQSCDRQLAQMSMLPSGDRKQYFISRVNACVMNHVIMASQTIIILVTSVLRHHAVKVTSSVLNPRCRRREQFLVLTNAHRVDRLLSHWCGKTQIARIEANVAEWNSGGRPNMKYVERQKLTYVDYKCSRIVHHFSCYIIIRHYF